MLESSSTALACAVGLLHALAVCAFAVRVWATCRARRWNVDDYIYTAAFIFASCHAVLILSCIVQGYGRYMQDIPGSELDRIALSHYIAQFLYVLSFGFGRISCALFLIVVAQASPLLWPARTTAVLSGVWSAASVICLAFHGSVGRPWMESEAQSLFFRWIGIEATGILVELSLCILATTLIWNLELAPSRRFSLAAVFGLRLLLIPIIATRIIFLQPSHQPWSAITPIVLSSAALAVSILAGCAATAPLPSCLAALHPAYAAECTRRLSKSAGDRYYRLDHLSGGGDRVRRTRPRIRRPPPRVATPDLAWMPYQGFSAASEDTAYPPRVHISSGRERVSGDGSAARGAAMADMEEEKMEVSPPLTIQKTTEVVIEYT